MVKLDLEPIDTDDGATDANASIDLAEADSSELSDEDLRKKLLEDTVLYAALGKSTFENGSISFRLPSRARKFRVTILGVSESGRYGTHTSFVQIQKPLNAILEFPDFIRQKDQLKLELILQNNTE